MSRWTEIAGGLDAGQIVVADTGSVGRVYDLDGELISRAPIRFSLGGRRLWSGRLGATVLTVSGSWDGGLAAYVDGVTTVAWDRPDIARPQVVLGVDDGVVVSTEGGGSWLLDANGRTRTRAPWVEGVVCAAGPLAVVRTRGRLAIAAAADLDVVAPVMVDDAVPTRGAPSGGGFVVGTIGGGVIGVSNDGAVRFVHRLPMGEVALAVMGLSAPNSVAVMARDTRSAAARLVALDGDGEIMASVPTSLPLDLAPFGDGRRFAAIYADRAKVFLLDATDGRRSPIHV